MELDRKRLILNSFTAKSDDPRGHLKQPFNWNGFSVATSGSAMVFILGEEEDLHNAKDDPRLESSLGTVSNLLDLCVKDKDCEVFIDVDLSECEKSTLEPCSMCKGSGVDICETCSHEHECPECEGACSERIYKFSKQGDRTWNNDLLFILEAMEARLRAAPIGEDRHTFIVSPDCFGVIMPCRDKSKDE